MALDQVVSQKQRPALTPKARIGRLAAELPQASRIFARHRIDYCCGGKNTLAMACADAGVDADTVIREIEEEIARDLAKRPATEKTIPEIIQFIQTTYHEPLREELPRLEEMAAKVARVHAHHDGVRLAALAQAVTALKDDLLPHLAKEDNILFPMILAGNGPMAQMPITRMEHEHHETAKILRAIRDLTGNFHIPPEACMTWRALWISLEELETSLHEHIHLENNVLFPKTLSI